MSRDEPCLGYRAQERQGRIVAHRVYSVPLAVRGISTINTGTRCFLAQATHTPSFLLQRSGSLYDIKNGYEQAFPLLNTEFY